MKKTSIWRDNTQTTDFKSLQGEASCDVAIIGGGITGITTACLLGKAGIKTIVLEALKVGGGTTGFSTGNLYATIDEQAQTIKSKFDLDKVKAVIHSRELAITQIRNLVTEYKLECELTDAPFYLFAEEENLVEKIEKEAEVLSEAGLPVSLHDRVDLPFKVFRALKLDRQGQFNPMQYIKGLAQQVNGSLCSIYENTKVLGYEKKEGNYQVQTSSGKVTAKHIIHATHTPKGFFGIQTLIYPYREYAVAYEYRGEYKPGIFWSIGNPHKHSIRQYRKGDQTWLMVLGEKHKTGQQEHNLKNIEALKEYASERFTLGEYSYQWGAQHYRCADGLPCIGKPQADNDMYFATGFSTDGLTYGTLAAQVLCDLVQGKDNPYSDVYNPRRFTPVQSTGEFIKENVNVLLQYAKNLPFVADVKDADQIKKGEGKVVQEHGEKLAVYKDDQDKLHICSAICPHMGCVVSWNEAEGTWDCPCHGSRFAIDGTLLEGPAISGLSKSTL
jgi:glycine/D-amino acid oxidase-like deaminating enzyme/nitrite reductase/ring-hydroxylating ferredoxin subunit